MSFWGKISDAWKKDIWHPITKATKDVAQGAGLARTPIPAGDRPHVDPSRAGAMAQYGNTIQNVMKTFNPLNMPNKYGEGYYRTRMMSPQVYSPHVALPSPVAQPTVSSGSNILNHNPIQSANPATTQAMSSSIHPAHMFTPQLSQARGGQVVSNDVAHYQPSMQSQGNIGYNPNGFLNQPHLQQVNSLNMESAIRPNNSADRNVIQNAISNNTAPLQLQQGLGNDYIQHMTDLANRRIDTQEQNAIRQIKDMQGRSGNLGSSVAQKQIANTIAEYDARKADAFDKAYLNNAQASREDRYRNLGANNAQTSLLSNLANTDYGMSMGNANFLRSGIRADNEARLNQAGFNNQVGQQDFANRNDLYNQDWNRSMAENRFNQGVGQQSFANQMALYNADVNQGRYADTLQNNAKAFNINQADTAEANNMRNYQEWLNMLAGYGSNQIDPQSMINYQIHQQEMANKQNKFNAWSQLAGKFIK